MSLHEEHPTGGRDERGKSIFPQQPNSISLSYVRDIFLGIVDTNQDSIAYYQFFYLRVWDIFFR
jgi:phosphopantetheinyl transferase